MARKKIEVDLRKAVGKLETLKGKEFQKVYRSAIRSGANVLKKETDRLYASRTKISDRKLKPTKSGKKQTDKPGQAKVSFDRNTGIVKVHILRDYMMKWFEMGTGTRVVKKATTTLMQGKNDKFFIRHHKPKKRLAGHLQPLHLFREANQRVQKEVYRRIGERIEKQIKKLNEKKQ